MTQKSERYFIYTWKEILVILLLAVIAMGFFFTLGLHYGKKIHKEAGQAEAIGKLEPGPETLPSREDLEQASRHALVATEDTIKAATQNEVVDAKIKMDAPKQVDLPAEKSVKEKSHVEKSLTEKPAKHEADGAYAIQLGSFPNRAEASTKVKSYSKQGISASVVMAKVGGKTRFRVVVPGFNSKKSAEEKAKQFKADHKIDGYVIIKN